MQFLIQCLINNYDLIPIDDSSENFPVSDFNATSLRQSKIGKIILHLQFIASLDVESRALVKQIRPYDTGECFI